MTTRELFPSEIGRFRIDRRVGHGMHGEVFRAHDPHLDREVAIKLLHPRHGGAVDGVPDEARILALLRHPNIVSVFEAGVHEGEPYYVMEYVPGTTLRALIERHGRMTRERSLEVMHGILSGMAHAHDEGVSHLDLAPGNVLIDTREQPRLMDFGLSRRANSVAETSDMLVGTPRYMTPEHFLFTGLGQASDVYALALILWEMLTGRPVVAVETLREVARVVTRDEPDWAQLRRCCNDAAIEAVLRVALDKQPSARYANAGALLAALAPLMPASGNATGSDKHATIAFLMHRMQRKQDFPALSRNLAEINRLTAPDSKASVNQVANVVLRDYAVSNKLLKLANSAYYGSTRGSVSKVSEAVSLLGFQRLRATCNGLMLFSHFGARDGDDALLDSLVSSFMCGLMARHLAQRLGLREPEDAFLCGLFRGLGRSLVQYYFAEEAAEIRTMVHDGGDETQATRTVLGISYDELAVAVAREWKFPDLIVDSLKPLPTGVVPAPASHSARLAAASGFAHSLIELAALPAGVWRDAMLEGLVERFAECLRFTPAQCRELLAAAVAKYHEFAPLIGVPVDRSRFLADATDLAGPEAMAKYGAGAEDEATTDGGERNPAPAGPAAVPAAAPAAPAADTGLLKRALRWLGRSEARA